MPVRPTRRLAHLNRLLCAAGAQQDDPLSADALVEDACQSTGLTDTGGEDFRPPLARLVHALEREAALSPVGRQITRVRLTDILASRLLITRDRTENPELPTQNIRRPLFIVGLPRSGTTILHHLLAQDQGSLTPMQWKLDFPSPPPPRSPSWLEKRFWKTRLRQSLLYAMLPELRVVHTVGASLPHECVVMMGHAFSSIVFSIPYRIPSYEEWLLETDFRSAYEWHKRFLQQFQLGMPDSRWVLKSPTHLLSLDTLFRIYPDACIVWTHRDPIQAMPSIASLTETLRRLCSDDTNPGDIAARAVSFWSVALARAQSFRESRPDLASRFIDLEFDDICRDPVDALRRIDAFRGNLIAPSSWRAIDSFARRHPRHRAGLHRYALSDYNLAVNQVAEIFAAYRKWREYDQLRPATGASRRG